VLPPFIVRVGLPAIATSDSHSGRSAGHLLWVGGPVPRGADGITIGSLVIVRRSTTSSGGFDALLRHEQVHVAQFRNYGLFGFLRRYLLSYARFRLVGYGHWAAYRRIPLEVEARWLALPTPASEHCSPTFAATAAL
jgi:hypothetical protein